MPDNSMQRYRIRRMRFRGWASNLVLMIHMSQD